MNKSAIVLGPEVERALKKGDPVVAVETGYLYHRDPFSDNIDAAMQCMSAIRKRGAVPAVIAVVDGALRVGLSEEETVAFLRTDGVVKCNVRDIATAIARGRTGSTTISAALHAAGLAGIRVLAAGGMGGVHRGGAQTLDVSPDLTQLAKTPVALVCSGPKAILDLELTMEYLETQSVSLVGYRTSTLPGYYLAETAYRLETAVQSPEEVALILWAKDQIHDGGGLIVANPINREYAVDAALFDRVMEEAVAQAAAEGVGGKQITAYLLDKVSQATRGTASEATRHIQLDNAALAAQIAVACSQLGWSHGS